MLNMSAERKNQIQLPNLAKLITYSYLSLRDFFQVRKVCQLERKISANSFIAREGRTGYITVPADSCMICHWAADF